VVHPVFGVEESTRLTAVALPACCKHPDVAACTEASTVGMVEHDSGDVVIALELGERVHDAEAHIGCQRMDSLRPVEPDTTEAALLVDDDFSGHWRVNSRPTIIRMIWLVPSRIECTRRSRQKRSMG
jgi:hypothetical protein